jgi:hypothetical protein
MAFDFRSKLRVSEHSHIAIETADFQLSQADGKAIKLSSLNGEAPISSARELILSGGPYATSEEAKAAGILWRRNLSIAFAQERVGIDFGQKSPEDSVRVSPHGSLTFDPEIIVTAALVSPADKLKAAIDAQEKRRRGLRPP